MPASTIAIIDDDDAVRDSLSALLEAKGFSVAAFASAEAFLETGRDGGHACALVDIRMPGMDGLALLKQLTADGMRLPIIMVTGHADVPLAVTAMKAGAADFVEKPYSSDAILEAVRRALELKSAKADAGDPAAAAAAERMGTLTPRERDVLEHLVIGHPNKIIAHELKISARTVEIHRANLMKKMQAESLSHLVRMALAAGIGIKSH